jgi:hypothetical protein
MYMCMYMHMHMHMLYVALRDLRGDLAPTRLRYLEERSARSETRDRGTRGAARAPRSRTVWVSARLSRVSHSLSLSPASRPRTPSALAGGGRRRDPSRRARVRRGRTRVAACGAWAVARALAGRVARAPSQRAKIRIRTASRVSSSWKQRGGLASRRLTGTNSSTRM